MQTSSHHPANGSDGINPEVQYAEPDVRSEVRGDSSRLPLLRLLQVSFCLQVSFKESEQAEVFPAVMAAVRRLSGVDAAVPHEAGGQVEGLGAHRAAVGLLSSVGVAVVPQQLLQPVALPTDVAVERLLPGVAPLVRSVLRRVGELLAADLASDDGVGGWQLTCRQLVGVFADDVVLQVAEALPADGAELPLAGVGQLVAAQVGGLREALPAGGAVVRSDLLVHQLVARQVAGVVETLPADVAGEGLVEVGHPVGLQHADAGVAFPADVAVAALLAGVPCLHVQVAVRLVVEPLGAEIAGVRQQPVRADLVFAKLQDSSEQCPAHRACWVGLLLVVGEPLSTGKQHAAP